MAVTDLPTIPIDWATWWHREQPKLHTTLKHRANRAGLIVPRTEWYWSYTLTKEYGSARRPRGTETHYTIKMSDPLLAQVLKVDGPQVLARYFQVTYAHELAHCIDHASGKQTTTHGRSFKKILEILLDD